MPNYTPIPISDLPVLSQVTGDELLPASSNGADYAVKAADLGGGYNIVDLSDYDLTWSSVYEGTLTMTYAQRLALLELAQDDSKPLYIAFETYSNVVRLMHFTATPAILNMAGLVSEPRIVSVDGETLGNSYTIGLNVADQSSTTAGITLAEYTLVTSPGSILSVWGGTETQYNAIQSPDSHTLYVVVEDPA